MSYAQTSHLPYPSAVPAARVCVQNTKNIVYKTNYVINTDNVFTCDSTMGREYSLDNNNNNNLLSLKLTTRN